MFFLGRLLAVLSIGCLCWAAQPPHEFHTSVTNIEYNAAQRVWEISLRLFTDDLESALSQNNGGRKFLIQPNDQNDSYIEQYLQKRFMLHDPERNNHPFSYLGKEKEADATWIYIEIPANASGRLDGWVLRNDVLMDIFDDQINLVNVKHPSGRKTYLYKKQQPVMRL
jgi:hypothetical protein